MKLIIDGISVIAEPDESLYTIIEKAGFLKGKLSTDPLAAKIAGEVFTLNYIPLRHKDVTERESMRRAMAASGGRIKLLRYSDTTGKEIYKRTSQFVLFLALSQLWPKAKAKMGWTVDTGIQIKVSGAEDFSVEKLKAKIQQIVADDIKLIRRKLMTSEAIEYYKNNGQDDKAQLLSYREKSTLNVYEHLDYVDYFYGEMAPSTKSLAVWDVLPTEDGFIFIFPDPKDPDKVASYHEMPNFVSVYAEAKNWGELMDCETVADLNGFVDSGRIRELIRVNEALHEKKYSQIADMICQRGSRAVMLAGPSSSGKTTSANRLATQLRVHGKKPILMSLDDYYLDRDSIPPGPDGKVDLEHINTIDTKLFGEQLTQLLKGNEVEIPYFNFKVGKREWVGHKLKLHENSVIIIEGIHGLNPALLPKTLDPQHIFKVFVTPLLPLNLDDHNRIPNSYLRLLRRIVRDYETRNASVSKTMSMWESVRRGETRWIMPFKENADVIFNSSTLYELCVLKKHIFPLLLEVNPEEECYNDVRVIVKILNYVHAADVDDEIPPTSVIREFIGGNSFYRTEKSK